MSLLLDALNRAQKNKSDEDKLPQAANDQAPEENHASLSTDSVDMEGLDLEPSNDAHMDDGSEEVSLENLDEQFDETHDDHEHNNELPNEELLSEGQSSADDSLEFSVEQINTPEPEFGQHEAVNSSSANMSDFSNLSLEDIAEKSEPKESRLANLLDEQLSVDSGEIEKAYSELESNSTVNEEIPAETEALGLNDKELANQPSAKTDEVSEPIKTEEKLPSSTETKNSILGKSTSLDIQKIRRQRKIRRVVITISSAIIASLVIAFAGYYYYTDQINSFMNNDGGKFNPAQFAGRSLTPPGAVPPEDLPQVAETQQVEERAVSIPAIPASKKQSGTLSGVESKIPAKKVVEKTRITKSSKKTPQKKTKQFVKAKKIVKTKPKPTKANKPKPTIRAQVNPSDSSVSESNVPIKSQKQVDLVHPVLLKAFDAFQTGDDKIAREKYFEVLRLDHNNRDALLGLAAVAVRQNQLDLAAQFYTRILQRNQSDSLARSALVGLVGQMDPVKAETELKLMLNNEPGAGYLHFALGNTYALQKRWLEAQNAFFNAYRIDSNNADYAYNLAVSLDHLGERSSAVNYYQKSLTNSSKKVVSFSSSQVKKRIQQLAPGS